MRLRQRPFRILALVMMLAVLLVAGCESSTMSVHVSTGSGMSGSFRTRTGAADAYFVRQSGTLSVQINTLKLESGTMELSLQDSAGKSVWQHKMAPADEGQMLQVTGDLPETGKWVLQCDGASQGKYDLQWKWQ